MENIRDWISWDFSVPEDGYYNISMRAQNLIRGMVLVELPILVKMAVLIKFYLMN